MNSVPSVKKGKGGHFTVESVISPGQRIGKAFGNLITISKMVEYPAEISGFFRRSSAFILFSFFGTWIALI